MNEDLLQALWFFDRGLPWHPLPQPSLLLAAALTPEDFHKDGPSREEISSLQLLKKIGEASGLPSYQVSFLLFLNEFSYKEVEGTGAKFLILFGPQPGRSSGENIFATHGLYELLQHPHLKRDTWGVLQTVIAKLKAEGCYV